MGVMTIEIAGRACRVTELAIGDDACTFVVADAATFSYYAIVRAGVSVAVDEMRWSARLGRWLDVDEADAGEFFIHETLLDAELRRALEARWP